MYLNTKVDVFLLLILRDIKNCTFFSECWLEARLKYLFYLFYLFSKINSIFFLILFHSHKKINNTSLSTGKLTELEFLVF